MVKVKICGLKRIADVEAVNIYRPDYAGFVFAPSKRRLTVPDAQALCAALDENIKRVGVFVNEKPETIREIQRDCGLDVLQIYDDTGKQEVIFSCPVWRVFRVRNQGDIIKMTKVKADAYVLDAYSKTAYGGTGKTFDWTLAKAIARRENVILAGGLTPVNIGDAIRCVAPYAVDVSSGVETDGRKDKEKIRDFINNVRRTG